jgi:hypothetical protein
VKTTDPEGPDPELEAVSSEIAPVLPWLVEPEEILTGPPFKPPDPAFIRISPPLSSWEEPAENFKEPAFNPELPP